MMTHPSKASGRSIGPIQTWLAVLFLALASGIGTPSVAQDQPPPPQVTSPFVATFDRFGRHDEIDEILAGELLVTELACTACHSRGTADLVAKTGPSLVGAGRRFQREWMTEFLTDPSAVKPGTTMPNVMAHMDAPELAESVDALVAFLSMRQADYPMIKASGANPVRNEFWFAGNADRGRELYHAVGCVACHQPDPDYEVDVVTESAVDRLLDELDPEELADMGLAGSARRVLSVPHGSLDRKYTRKSLAHFLYQPEHTRPGGRMPNLDLGTQEAADIAEYLLADQPKPTLVAADQFTFSATSSRLVSKGKRLFASLGCAQCHQAGVPAVDRFAESLAKCDAGDEASCIAGSSGAGASYSLDGLQQQRLADAVSELAGDSPRNKPNSPDESISAATRTMMRLNCYACHSRDDLGGVGRYRKDYFETVRRVDLGDEGRLPPPLDGVGRKLKKTWMKGVFKGDQKTRLRPHMTIRMPKFHGEMIGTLPNDFAKADQADDSDAAVVFGKRDAIAESGKALMDIGCVQCHAFDGQTMPGVIGVDLAGVADRIHPRWFAEFVMDPGSVKKRTRMPTFFPDGKSQNPNLLGGDAKLQIAAMWDYLENIKTFGVPEKIKLATERDYRLQPRTRPILLRTFMADVGTHAIAVGFSGGTHVAFDAANPRIAIGWKDGFLDARSTWFERFAPMVDPIGEQLRSIDSAVAVVKLAPEAVANSVGISNIKPDATVRFLGYRLDADGVPTFRYQVGGVVFADQIDNQPSGGIWRRLSIESTDDENDDSRDASRRWYFIASSGKALVADDDQCKNELGVTTRSLTVDTDATLIRSKDGQLRWLIPIDPETGIQVLYQW